MKFTPYDKFITVLAVVVASLYALGFAGVLGSSPKQAAAPVTETIYVVNKAPVFISDATIRRDIPAWEQAMNKDVAPIWHTPQVKIELTTRAPADGVEVEIVKNGPVRGALAYHTVGANRVPKIVDYAGVNDFYGYSNSVSITHELEEMLADPNVSTANQGYPYPEFCTTQTCFPQAPGTFWINEISDPVESYSYRIDGVAISDFVTPNWFNDRVKGQFDYMGLVPLPFTVMPGGYATFWNGEQWMSVENFRHAGRDAAGYYKGENLERR